jgi:hypothetical protein
MKIQEIKSLLGVSPSTYNDWQNNPEKKNLAALLSAIPKELAAQFVKNGITKKKAAPAMLLATINCSIGNKSNHLNAVAIRGLLAGKSPQNNYEKYAIDIMKSEATDQEIESFARFYRIPKKSIKAVLHE